LAIPPAWTDVWICPWSNGHIQAVGTDAAGRHQYRYHDQWRIERDKAKFDRVLEFAAALPNLRKRVGRDLEADGLSRDRVLAAIVRLLDVGFFRVGGEEYAHEHETFGVASLRKEHVRIDDGAMVFHYPAKASVERIVEVRDVQACDVVAALRRRRSGGANLFAYRQGRRWVEVHAQDVNEYIKGIVGNDFSAKDFRTWSATVVAAAALAEQEPAPDSGTGRHQAVRDAVAEVAEHLGNTPAVSRSSYIDPRVVERFEDGETINATSPRRQPLAEVDQRKERGEGPYQALENAVIELLDGDVSAG
jgi:DNA topoisomerase IB